MHNLNNIRKPPYFKLFICSFLFNLCALFYQLMPPFVFTAFSITIVIIYIATLRKIFSINQVLFILLIALVPSSFVSVFGVKYALIPISMFSLVAYYLLFRIIGTMKIGKWYLLSLLIFIFFALISIFSFEYKASAVMQVLNIFTLLLAFIIGSYFYKKESSTDFLRVTKNIYVQTTLIFAISVLIQRAFITNSGNVIGKYGEYALGRISYAGIMGDFSFASLFIATGWIALIFTNYKNKIRHVTGLIVGSAVFSYALVSVNARTGLLALASAIIVGLIYAVINKKKLAIIAGILAIIVIFSVGIAIINNRGLQPITDGSSRNAAYVIGLSAFKSHPFLGVGFGQDNLSQYLLGLPLPHNFFIQYLMNGGIIGLIIILLPFILYLKLPLYKDIGIFLMLVAVFAGSMFIPDIFSSRFLFVIIVMSFISCGNYLGLIKRKKKT